MNDPEFRQIRFIGVGYILVNAVRQLLWILRLNLQNKSALQINIFIDNLYSKNNKGWNSKNHNCKQYAWENLSECILIRFIPGITQKKTN